MSIVLYLGYDINEYNESSAKKIQKCIENGEIICENCSKPLTRHSTYDRTIKEKKLTLTITMVWCKKCKIWHSLQPDFLLPRKHYSGAEVEDVIIESEFIPVDQINTPASESTRRRWIRNVGDNIRRSVSLLKYLFGRMGQAVSEIAIKAGSCYNELQQILKMAPADIKNSGCRLGLANLWLSERRDAYI